jgi:hypothetical protein
MRRIAIGVAIVLVGAALALRLLGSGWLGSRQDGGTPRAGRVPDAVLETRRAAQAASARAVGASDGRQILFGDLHVHSTFSTDAFLMSLPMNGGDGARPVSDACDFARICSGLDFWSINDHALALTQRRWDETVEAIRACQDVSGPADDPDVAVFLGWEWTQVGTTPDNHYGHKNVVLRHLDDAHIPGRPIAASLPGGSGPTGAAASPWALGLLPLTLGRDGIALVKYFDELLAAEDCPKVPVDELPRGCIDRAPTPSALFDRLDEWGHEALVIPHGTTWGYYTPLGSTWDKQLTPAMHDPARQRLIEVYSGHGNSEEYRSWRGVDLGPGGERRCPPPSADHLPSCWQAGEIIRARCLARGEAADECETRARTARTHYLDGDVAGNRSVPAEKPADWLDSGQCRDCFLPAFNYRPGGSAQYILALGRRRPSGEVLRFRFGLMASSDNHSSRPGTGYKEYGRADMTEYRFRSFGRGLLGAEDDREPVARSEPVSTLSSTQFFAARETERQASFFLTGGLVAAHADGRGRDAVWSALQRREVYGTSGPRILLWFDLLNPPGTRGAERPMGSEVRMVDDPIFSVRAVGSFEQRPGCPEDAPSGVDAETVSRLCRGECYHPSDVRRLVDRIEVIRIRPQRGADEDVDLLIEDPWRVFACQPDPAGCRVTFTDPSFSRDARDAVYYVRAIETPSLAVDADPLACQDAPADDDCLGRVQERAWSSPIFVDQARGGVAPVSRSEGDGPAGRG